MSLMAHWCCSCWRRRCCDRRGDPIKLDSKGPVFYRRSASASAAARSRCSSSGPCAPTPKRPAVKWAQKNDPRVTRIGQWLRRFRIDELPQILNVVKGEMGIVGPRPERPEFVAKLRRPDSVLRLADAGAAGDYRVGADSLSRMRPPLEEAREKLQYDLWYVKHLSVRLDLAILVSYGQGRHFRARRALPFLSPVTFPEAQGRSPRCGWHRERNQYVQSR